MTTEEIQSSLKELESFWRTSQNEKALELSEVLLPIVFNINNKIALVRIQNILGNIHSDTADLSKAIEHYSKAIHIAEELKDKRSISISLGNKAIVYRKMGDYVQSLQFHHQSIALLDEIDFPLGIATNYGNIGIVYRFLADYEKALEYYEKALTINIKINNIQGIADNYTSIGVVNLNLKFYEKSIEYFQEALHWYTQSENNYGIAISYNNIGLAHSNLHNYSESIEYAKLSLEINEKIQHKNGIAANYLHIGQCYFSFEEYTLALEYYHKSLAIEEEIGNGNGLVITFCSLAEVYTKIHRLDDAETNINKGIQLAEKFDDKLSLMKLYQLLSEIHEQKLSYKDAYHTFKEHSRLKNEIESKEAIDKARLFDQKRIIEDDEKSRQLKLARFKEQERIFHNILPITIANRLIEGERTIAESHENVSIFFSDIVGFTELSSLISPRVLVEGLNSIFTTFDRIGSQYGLEKIKTIGDAYMAVCGIPMPYNDHCERTAHFALEVLKAIETLNIGEMFAGISVRIGIHCGNVVAGIIGERKFAYDVWGDSVNIASRMESRGEPNRIHISEQFAKSIDSHPEFLVIPRGEITIKGKGTMNTYWLEKGKVNNK